MPLHQLQIDTTLEYAEAISDYLTLLGAYSVTMQDIGDEPIFEPLPNTTPLWQKLQVTGLFVEPIEFDNVLVLLRRELGQNAIEKFNCSELPEQDWVKLNLASFQPIKIGKNMWICPSWESCPDSTAVTITLDPGLAFGTGSHPTTALCLAWLEEHVTPGTTIIDYGCGSGILAIAASKLGAKKVWAIDYDPQALTATESNALINKIPPSQIEVLLPEQFSTSQADLLVANILATPLVELAEKFAHAIKPLGLIALSGILESQVNWVKEAYSPWFDLNLIRQQDEWMLVGGIRKKSQ